MITRRLERMGYRHGPCDPFPSVNDTGVTRVAAFFFVGPRLPSAAFSTSEARQQWAGGWERGSERPKDKTTKRKLINIKNITRILPKYNIY